MQLLLTAGASPDGVLTRIREGHPQTYSCPLAFHADCPPALQLLLDAGADPQALGCISRSQLVLPLLQNAETMTPAGALMLLELGAKTVVEPEWFTAQFEQACKRSESLARRMAGPWQGCTAFSE